MRFWSAILGSFLIVREASADPQVVTDFGNTYEIDYDPDTQQIVMKAHVKQNAWLGVGFDTTSMPNANMVVFQGEGENGIVTDRYSTGFHEPEVQAKQDLTVTSTRSADAGYDFVVTRPPSNDNS